MDMQTYAETMSDIANWQKERTQNAVSEFIGSLQQISGEAHARMVAANSQLFGESISVEEEQPKEIARGLFG